MIDYIKTLNYMTDKLTDMPITNTSVLITAIIAIIIVAIPIILAFVFDLEAAGKCISIYGLIFIILCILHDNKIPKNINKQILKEQNITETIDIKLLSQAYKLNIKEDGVRLNPSNDNTHYNNFKLSAILDHLNIKSINNFCSNIIYLDNYYSNHYQEQSKYDWINQKLNEFYKPNNNTNASTDELLKNLKN